MELQAEEVSRELGSRHVRREQRSFRDVWAEAPSGLVYVVRRVTRRDGTHELRHELCDGDGGRLYANPRMWRLVTDVASQPLVRAVSPPGAVPPQQVLDAMAGLGGTALRLAHACGRGCRVTATEVSAPLACLLRHGLLRLAAQGEEWSEPAQRVEARCAEAGELLKAWAAVGRTVDVVYLNPCLAISRRTKEDLLLQKVACLRPVAREAFEAAAACAAHRVVLRHPRGAELPFGLAEASLETRVRGGRSDFLVVATR